MTYEYRCSGCGRTIESDRVLAPGSKHMVGGPKSDYRERKTCGTLKRVWYANFARIPGGARQ